MIDEKNMEKLRALGNERVIEIVNSYVELCKPEKVSVLTDSEEDIRYIREMAIRNGEEMALAVGGQTVHFDGYYDQARDKKNTKVLIEPGEKMSKGINTGDRITCLEEIHQLLDGIMKGKEMFVKFYCLGPKNSRFSLLAMQITDSAYVVHSEDVLYRQGYSEFKKMENREDFFYFVHSAGELENGVSKNIDKRRIYVDLKENRVFSVNTQYAGNTVGLKKLAFRLAIVKSHNENWLAEHMFIMGVHRNGKTNYFTGAFPSACGKTSTAMISGQTIVGDDLAYLKNVNGEAYGANPESGIFGIIRDVNPKDDPVIYKVLTEPNEIIFTNILVHNKKPYWTGMGMELPKQGINHSGEWYEGKKDNEGNEIPPSSRNARYTIRLKDLKNVDKNAENPNGVRIEGMIFGGRDSDTSPPVYESFDWTHGVFVGATIESETTAATLGKTGIRKHNPMAILDFLVIPFKKYLQEYVRFGETLSNKPKIFATNYFLKENGQYLNSKLDKKVWLMWMHGRVNGEFGGIKTPIGVIPKYEDLKDLFKKILNKEYTKEEYERQFSIRIDKFIERMERMRKTFEEDGVPDSIMNKLISQTQRLLDAKQSYGEVISPFSFS